MFLSANVLSLVTSFESKHFSMNNVVMVLSVYFEQKGIGNTWGNRNRLEPARSFVFHSFDSTTYMSL